MDVVTEYMFPQSLKKCGRSSMRKLINGLCYIHIYPLLVITGQGTQFNSNMMNQLLTLLEFRPEGATLKQLETIGVAMRSDGALKRSLKKYEKQMQHNWLIYINLADFQYDKSIHSTTGFPPSLVFYGRTQ